ncbi:MAG: Lrp/AsnC family transcriptional regulator [Methanomassiliicoccales archaeon]|nr:MAG: Lrp/AsnC family transcriptional regulator [Methanomassiliicoccales archaeon]
MTNLSGRSIILLKVFPDQLGNAHREISRMPNVTNVWPILGSYDLLVSAGFSDYEGLRNLVGEMRSKPYCQECKVHPGFMDWEREGARDTPMKGWVFIDTADFDSTFEELKKIDKVNYVVSISGEYNMVAGLGVEGFQEYGNILRNNVLTIPGVRRTETYTHTPE